MKRDRGGEGEGVEQGLDKPLDFLATYEERISARLLTSDLGNSTVGHEAGGDALGAVHVDGGLEEHHPD